MLAAAIISASAAMAAMTAIVGLRYLGVSGLFAWWGQRRLPGLHEGLGPQIRREIGFEGFTWPERFLVVTTTEDMAAKGYAILAAEPESGAMLIEPPAMGKSRPFPIEVAADPAWATRVMTEAVTADCQPAAQ